MPDTIRTRADLLTQMPVGLDAEISAQDIRDTVVSSIGARRVSSVTANTTIADDSSVDVLLVDATSGAVTITLPAAATNAHRVFTIKKIDSVNNVVVDGNGAETIDGAANVTLNTQFQRVTVACNGTGWFIID